MIEEVLDVALSGSEPRGLRVLDAGCGLGPAALAFARRGAASVVGVDLSGGSLRRAMAQASSEGLRTVHFQRMNLYDLAFENASFDLVFCQGIWGLVDDKRRVASEYFRVLRPGGTFLTSFHARSSVDPLVNAVRAVGCRLPSSTHLPLARIGSRVYKGVEGLLRHRQVALHADKAPAQTFYEIFFAPKPMRWPDAGDLRSLLENVGFDVKDLSLDGTAFGRNERIYRSRKPSSPRGGSSAVRTNVTSLSAVGGK
jgi:ubiquinone/menaquinone biosynthesis C-methylase UbiE